ncbi:MAG: kynureninase/PvdN C-terminal domain-containing protein, partial [Candidatus Bathycorpusculaceae bacterium]
ILKLTDRLIEAIKNLGLKLFTPEERQHRSGIVLFGMDEPQELVTKLRQKGIVVSARAHGIRVSPHFYNMEEEIDRLVEEIRRCK